MNTLSSLLNFLGNTLGANPNTLATSSKTIVGAINELDTEISGLINVFYPVGSYYETSDLSFDPNAAWGGTWVKDSAGRVTVAQDTTQTEFDTIGETGGNKSIQAHTHAFTQPKIPNHVHTPNSSTSDMNFAALRYISGRSGTWNIPYESSGDARYTFASNNSSSDLLLSHTTGNPTSLNSCTNGAVGAVSGASTGSSGNLQPYIVVNRWHRTA